MNKNYRHPKVKGAINSKKNCICQYLKSASKGGLYTQKNNRTTNKTF